MTGTPTTPSPDGVGTHDVFADQVLGFFRLLSDRTRLSILLLLRDGEKNVTTLCDRLKLPQPTVSHHLGLLRNNQLIDNRRSGKQIFYGLSKRFVTSPDGGLRFTCDHFVMNLEPAAKESVAKEQGSRISALAGSMDGAGTSDGDGAMRV